jgi:hypothetical protein
MPTDPQSFTFLIGLARGLLAQVTGRDGLEMRPVEVRAAVIARLAAGVRVLASFVRRLLVLMALSFEHGLVDRAMRLCSPQAPRHSMALCVAHGLCVGFLDRQTSLSSTITAGVRSMAGLPARWEQHVQVQAPKRQSGMSLRQNRAGVSALETLVSVTHLANCATTTVLQSPLGIVSLGLR